MRRREIRRRLCPRANRYWASKRWRRFGVSAQYCHDFVRPVWNVAADRYGSKRYLHLRIWAGRVFVAFYLGDPAEVIVDVRPWPRDNG